jgi:hypothetical protein
MSTVKIEHVNPNTAHPIAFDMLSAPRKDKDGNPVKSTKNDDGTLTYEDGTVVHVDKDGNEIRDTMIIAPGHFKILSLSGGLMLHEVSQAELTERDRKISEQRELQAEVARERKAKEDHEHAEKVKAEREEHKKKIADEAAKQDKAAADDASAEKSHDATFGDNWKPEQSRPVSVEPAPVVMPDPVKPQPEPVV